jgi:RNA polymerase sigma factor (sigma-70 family)
MRSEAVISTPLARYGFAQPASRAYHGQNAGEDLGRDMAEDALAGIFLANRGALLRYLRARGATDDAEDLLQDLWLKLRGVEAERIGDGLAYLYRMAHNLMLDRRRAGARRRQREEGYHRDVGSGDGGADDAPAAERILLAREQLRQIDWTLSTLGTRTDFIFRRYRVDGAAQRDIATELGISVSAVEKHLQKAYRAVADAQRVLDRADDRDVAREGSPDDAR